MARTLKNNALTTALLWVVAVDDDNASIKGWTTAGSGPAWSSGSGLTLTSTSVTTAKTWKSVSVPMITMGTASTINITTAVGASSPCTYFMVWKDWASTNTGQVIAASATAGGALDTARGPWIENTAGGTPVLRNGKGGTALSFPMSANDTATTALTANTDFSAFIIELSGANNPCYWALEASALAADGFVRTDQGINLAAASNFAKQIGYTSASSTSAGDLVMIGAFNNAISEANAAAIHSDPFGSLFETASSGFFARHYYDMIGQSRIGS